MLLDINYERFEDAVVRLNVLDMRFVPSSISLAESQALARRSLVLIFFQDLVPVVLCAT